MSVNGYTTKLIQKVIANNSKLRDNHIDRYGIAVMIYTNNNTDNLTGFGEVSLFARREGHKIMIMPNFDITYLLLSFNVKGRADELDEGKQLEAFVKITEDVNQGDVIELTFSYFENTVDAKFYQITQVLVDSIYNPLSKKITMSPYFLPVTEQESQAVNNEPLPATSGGFIIG